jgi:tetratricopeptide (TPR) repeat protein
MKITAVLLAALLTTSLGLAQRHKLESVNTETEEGKLLQAIGTEADPAKKIAMMEEFTTRFGKHEAVAWVWSQLQPAYTKAGQHDKAINTGERLLALDPMDIEAAYGNLKASEASKNSDGVLKWAVVTSDIAKKTPGTPKKEGQSDEEYKYALDFAKQVDTYTEYSLHASALAETDPTKVMRLTETLEQRNPQSQYVPLLLSKYAAAARQANAMANAVALGERTFARNQVHEDMLLAMADHYMQQKNADKVEQYAAKAVEVISAKPKPEGVSDADWEKKKNTTIGAAHWMAGMTAAGTRQWPAADKSLRAALPYIKDNDQMVAPALLQLGFANYQMGKGKSRQQMTDALRYFQQCAAIKSQYQALAQKNVAVIQKETRGAAR